MKVILMTFNAKFIHKALSLRWLYVARDKSYDTEIVEYTIRDNLNHCVQDMISRKPDVIGCSVYIWNAEIMKEFITEIKKALPEVRIILGGPEVTYESEEWLDYDIECILRGEGERTFWQAVNREERIDGYFSKSYISDVGYARSDLNWLETLESPYFLDFDLKDSAHRYFYFETSRGCPFQCSYCLSSLDNKVRFFSFEYVKKQLLQLKKVPVKQIKLLDRTFNASEKMCLDFLMFLEEQQIPGCFQFEVVADRLSDRVLDFLLHEATVSKYRFEIGIQSFNLKTLKSVGRIQDLSRCKEVIRVLTERGYQLHVDLIGGLPYEDLESFKCSFNELFSSGAKEIQVGILKLLKGTRIKNESKNYGIVAEKEAPYTTISTSWLNEDELKVIEDVYHATEKFYNHGRIYKTMQILYAQKLLESPFDVLSECGKRMNSIKNIQVRDFYLIAYEVLLQKSKADLVMLQGLLQNEYVMQFKVRTKKLFENVPAVELRSAIIQYCIEYGLLDENTVYNYTDFVYGWINGGSAVQLLIYNAVPKMPDRIWFDLNGRMIKDERNLDCNIECA